jgi:glycosyltransferase involved in cell wall biosynthesis
VTGLLVSPGQPAEVCRALLRLAQGEELRTRLGAAGRDRASTMYRADTAINALQSMYDDLLERSAA